MIEYSIDEIPEVCGIYMILCRENGKFYVGSSNNLRSRIVYQHFNSLKKNKHENSFLQKVYNKYGIDTFICRIIIDIPENQQFEIEQQYLDMYYDGQDMCLNANPIAIKPPNHSKKCYKYDPYTLEKVAEYDSFIETGNRGHIYLFLNNKLTHINYNFYFTEIPTEYELKIKQKNFLRKYPYVFAFIKTGKCIGVYKSQKEAGNKLHVFQSNIGKILNDKRSTSNGYTFSTRMLTIPEVKQKFNGHKKPVVQLTKSNKYIKTFNSIKEASKELNVYNSSITSACKNINKTAYGFKWMYLSEYDKL